MISVAEATSALLELVAPLPSEAVPLRAAAGRAMSGPIHALHDQPPFAASAMDGYAVIGNAKPGDTFHVIGESAAGHPFTDPIDKAQALRIFTGAPLPPGATRVVIQEDVTRDGDRITVTDAPDDSTHIRPAAGDFGKGTTFRPDHLLASRDIALIAAMGHGVLSVARRPTVAILMTGDELQMPGTTLSPGQIPASNGYGLAAMFDAAGARSRILPIARDSAESLNQAFKLARGADLIVTIGGASVGDHDLIAPITEKAGMIRAFHKVAMRPGKPLLAGKMGNQVMVGLPGNPVSAMICGVIFILPMLRKMLGLSPEVPMISRTLTAPLAANGPRQHYMRAQMDDAGVTVKNRQDSSLLSVLSRSNALVVRAPIDPAREAGEHVPVIVLPD